MNPHYFDGDLLFYFFGRWLYITYIKTRVHIFYSFFKTVKHPDFGDAVQNITDLNGGSPVWTHTTVIFYRSPCEVKTSTWSQIGGNCIELHLIATFWKRTSAVHGEKWPAVVFWPWSSTPPILGTSNWGGVKELWQVFSGRHDSIFLQVQRDSWS